MNYERIYNEFIADRKAKEADLIASGEYFEKHHIVPKSLSGSDDADNLVALTAADHFMAHLLLAKAHGGTQWNSVALMCERKFRKNAGGWKPKRIHYGLMKKHLASHKRDTQLYDKSKRACTNRYDFYSVDGKRFSGTRTQLAKHLDVSSKRIAPLFSATPSSVFGWACKQTMGDYTFGQSKGADHPQADKALYTLKNESGQVFVGNRYEFVLLTGGKYHSVARFLRGERKSFMGWFDPTRFAAKDVGKKSIGIGVVCLDTKVEYESATKAAIELGMKSSCHILSVCTGRRKSAGGYRWAYA